MKRLQLKKDLYVDWIDDKRYISKILILKKLNNECLKNIAKMTGKELQDK